MSTCRNFGSSFQPENVVGDMMRACLRRSPPTFLAMRRSHRPSFAARARVCCEPQHEAEEDWLWSCPRAERRRRMVSMSMSKQWKQETAIVIAIAIVARCLSCLRRLTPEARSAGFGFPVHSVL